MMCVDLINTIVVWNMHMVISLTRCVLVLSMQVQVKPNEKMYKVLVYFNIHIFRRLISRTRFCE